MGADWWQYQEQLNQQEMLMAIIAKDSGGTDFPKAPAGTHVARCFQIIDLGHQQVNVKGKDKILHKVRLGFELCNEPMEDGRPFVLSREYTLSLYESSNLRVDLQAWRGREFTEEELEGFDVEAVCGAYCMLNVVHKVAKNGKTYANIAAIMALPKGMEKPAPVNEEVIFRMDGTGEPLSNLPEWIQEDIRESEEYRSQTPSQNSQEEDDDEPAF